MKFSKVDFTVPRTKEYRIHGSAVPTEKNPRPQVFVATVYTTNHVLARSRFLRMLEKKHKVKTSKGMIIDCSEVVEPGTGELRNYGVRFVYRSKRGIHNSYKECRALSRCGAIDYVLREVSGRHRVKRADVDIIGVEVVGGEELRRPKTMEFANEDVEFPVFSRIVNTMQPFVPVCHDLSN